MNLHIQIEKELLAIKGNRELLSPHAVVKWAKAHKKSALHKKFQWDIRKAAQEHWLDTARRLIILHIVADDGGPQLVSLTIDRHPGGGYRDRDDVAKVPDLMKVLLIDAVKELRRVQAKYARVTALKEVWSAVDAVGATVKKAA
jgi:hypothetical protein